MEFMMDELDIGPLYHIEQGREEKLWFSFVMITEKDVSNQF